jgi:hypothetical protein
MSFLDYRLEWPFFLSSDYHFYPNTPFFLGGGGGQFWDNCIQRILRMIMINEPNGIENATHNTFAKLTWIFFLIKKHKT